MPLLASKCHLKLTVPYSRRNCSLFSLLEGSSLAFLKKFNNLFNFKWSTHDPETLVVITVSLWFQGKNIGENSKKSIRTTSIYHVYWILLVKSIHIEKICTNYWRHLVSWGDILILKLFSLLAAFLNLDCTVLLTHLHNIPGMMKVAMGNICFCVSKAYPLSSASLLKEVLRSNEEVSSDLLAARHQGYVFTTPIFIRCNCSPHRDVVLHRVGNNIWLKTRWLKPFVSISTLMLLVFSSSWCIRYLL